MTNCVDVRINDVDHVEISNISTLFEAMSNPSEYDENVIGIGPAQNYVVTVKTGELRELKDALRVVLKVVTPERVDIEPWDGAVHS